MNLNNKEFPEGFEQKFDVVKSLLSVPVREINYLKLYFAFLVIIAVLAFIQEYFEFGNFFTFIVIAIIPFVFLYDSHLSRKRRALDDQVESILVTVGCTMVSGDLIVFKDTGDVVHIDELSEIIASTKSY